MNKENLNEFANYLDKGDFGGRTFSMGAYQSCVLGQYVARELNRRNIPVSDKTLSHGVEGVALRVFGIRQATETDEWTFAFGAQWGNDHRAAAKRLRYLAIHGGVPHRSAWDLYRSATDEKAVAQYTQTPEQEIVCEDYAEALA